MSELGQGRHLHWAVIMARGRSRRMGFPKGRAVIQPGGPALLVQVEAAYKKLGFPRVIVTLPSLMDDYGSLIQTDSDVHWVVEPDGGDTARTLFAAWLHLREQPVVPTHIWAHPVDLPQVKPATLTLIRAQVSGHPDCVVRPVHQGQPGHPVVIPLPVLGKIFQGRDRSGLAGPMRHLLALAADNPPKQLVLDLPVEDPGVVQDYDDPASLGANPEQEK